MGLFSSFKNKTKGGSKMNILINPNILNELKDTLKSQNKTAVRFELAGFG